MFRFIEKNKIVVQIILTVVVIIFTLGGLEAFFVIFSNDKYIVKLAEEKITTNGIKDFLNDHKKDYSIQNVAEAYNNLLTEAALVQYAKKIGVSIIPIQIKESLYSIPNFQNDNGIFDESLFNNYLKINNKSEEQFLNSIKKQLYIKNIMYIFNNGLIISDMQINSYINALLSKKQVQKSFIYNKSLLDKIPTSDIEVNKFYQENAQKYIQAPAVKFEYIKISPETIMSTQNVSETEIKEYFDKIKKTGPQRIIYSILIAFPKNVEINSTIIEQLKQKAQILHQKIISHPETFESLAKEYSDDKKSSIYGGKLGLMSKNNGKLAKPIEDIVFNLQAGKISDIIPSNDGFHIFKAERIVNGVNLFQEKDNIIYLLKQDKSISEINKIKTTASEVSFENYKELNSTADAIGIKMNKFDTWITKDDAQKYNIPNKVINNLFSLDVFQEKNNSNIIDINNQESWIVRVTNTRQKKKIPLNEIKDKVINDYKNLKVKDLVKLEAQKTISSLQKSANNINLTWSPVEEIDYKTAQDVFDENGLNKFIQAKPHDDHPVFFLVENDTGCIIIKVNKIIFPTNVSVVNYQHAVKRTLFELQLNSLLQKQTSQFKKGTQQITDK